MQWKGGLESRWLGSQTIRLRSETGEWEGAQLPKAAMWSLKAVSLPAPPIPERGKYFKALDVAAWNNEQSLTGEIPARGKNAIRSTPAACSRFAPAQARGHQSSVTPTDLTSALQRAISELSSLASSSGDEPPAV